MSIQTDLRLLLRKAVSRYSFYQARPQYDQQMPTLLREAAGIVRAGKLKLPVAAIYPMSRIVEAVEHAIRGGEVLPDLESGNLSGNFAAWPNLTRMGQCHEAASHGRGRAYVRSPAHAL